MTQQNNSSQKIVVSEDNGTKKRSENQLQNDEKNIPIEYVFEFISKHHLNRLWDEFIYEKRHPKIELSAYEVLAMVNLPPEEQERILKTHE